MRVGRLLLFFSLSSCFLFSATAFAQQTSPPPVQRDPQAVAIVQKSLVAMGGIDPSLISGTIAQATVTFVGGNQQISGAAVFKTGGLGQVRADYQVAGQASSFVYSGGNGARRNPDGTVTNFRPADTINKHADHLPLLSMLAEYADPAIDLRLLGQENADGAVCWHLYLQRQILVQGAPNQLLAPFAGTDIFVDQTTGLVVKIRYQVASVGNLRDVFPMEFEYSDYRPEGGLLVPHTVAQSAYGHRIAIFQITSFAVNAAVTATDFELPR